MLSQAKLSRAIRKRLHCKLRFLRPEILLCSEARQIQQPPFFTRPSPPPRSVLPGVSALLPLGPLCSHAPYFDPLPFPLQTRTSQAIVFTPHLVTSC